MKGMACKLFSPFKSHPLIACSVLLLFTPPIFPMVIFFWPLIVSTALGVLAVISFGRQGEDTASITGRDHTESAVRMADVAFPSQAETISNVLMVGNQEVTWLEWLHNEDTQKFRTQESEHAMPAVWDADGCDVSFAASKAVVDATAWRVEDMGNVYACEPITEEETFVRALVLTAENEIRATALTVASLDGIRVNAIALVESNEEDTKKNALSFIAEDETKKNALDMTAEDDTNRNGLGSTAKDDENMGAMKQNVHSLTAEDEMKAIALHTTAEDDTKRICCDGRNAVGIHCRNALDSLAKYEAAEDMRTGNGLDSIVENEIDVNSPACGDGVVGQIRIDGVGLSGESESMVSAFESGIGNAHSTVVSSLGATIDDKSKMNDCITASGDEGETRSDALFLTREDEIRENASKLSSPNITISVILERKAAEGHEMRHIDDEQDQEERDFKQIDTQVPQWDVSDDEEDESSLRFSFFDNGCFIATPVKHEPEECSQ